MRKSSNNIIFSASDLSNHIHCKHLTNLNKKVIEGELSKPFSTSRLLDLLREKGDEFEKSFLQTILESGKNIIEIDTSNSDAENETILAMKKGVDYIYQARLCDHQWQGWADFLVKVYNPSELGEWSYEVIDTKLATHTRAGTILQIALYSEIIAKIQGIQPKYMHVKTPEDEIKYRVNDYIAYLRLTKRRFTSAIENPIDTYPEPCNHCDICNWWESCNKKRRSDDHLSFIAGMGNSQIKEVRLNGVNTLQQMANLTLPISFIPSKGSIGTFTKLREQARVQFEVRKYQKPIYEILDRVQNSGFYNLPEPSEGDIYLDFEGDPMAEPSGLEYLFGWVYKNEYFKIWVKNEEEEKNALEKFIDFIFEKRNEFPNLHIYHFAPYETVALKRMVGKYAVKENEIDILLRTNAFTDLHRVLKQSIRAGVERYSLKDLEKYYGYIREMDLRDLSKIKSEFEFLLETKRFDDMTKEMYSCIALYNEDDCKSTLQLHKWLENERKKLVLAGESIPRPDFKNEETPENISAHLERIQPIYDYLMLEMPVSKSERTNIEQAQFILANMLDWYRREDKSFWWEYFRILQLQPDELLDEKTTITFLKYTGERIPDKRSFIDTYTFPNQDYEFRIGDIVKNQEGNSTGTIVEIDQLNNILKLKKGTSILDDHPDTIIKFEHFPTSEKVNSIIDFAEWIVENGFNSELSNYRSTRDLLLNILPRIVEPKFKYNNSLENCIDWARKLDYSYLPMQGPPGTGKSYTASNVIFELIKSGKKIGITALSHKVIIGLLNKVKDVADNNNFIINIIYKTSTKDDTNYTWKITTKVDDIVATLPTFNVFAGTSFMWCNNKLKDSLDYLFVDEAGQFALIDTLVISQATKNLVLLGDPQQLKQPIKGIHPEGTEVSALEHVLKEHKTIPDDKGIFLEKTWRMHPSICAFDSEMFYESRLFTVENLQNQRIEGNTQYMGSGFFYKQVEHEGNTNSSLEEVSQIVRIVNELTKGDVFYFDKDNNQKIVSKNDIKIITPYNNNVFLIKNHITDIEVGSVDKFQGQEAPIIIYSMATSSPEDAPRGMEFLYSPNRFNVAISRARAIFILVGNPKLFEPDCKTPEQIKLANPFCRYLELCFKHL